MSTVIGRVSIKVTPDLKGFAAQIRAQMEALQDETLRIKAVLDSDEVRRDIERIAAQRRDFHFDGKLNFSREDVEQAARRAGRAEVPGDLAMSAAQMRKEAETKKPRDVTIPMTGRMDRRHLDRRARELSSAFNSSVARHLKQDAVTAAAESAHTFRLLDKLQRAKQAQHAVEDRAAARRRRAAMDVRRIDRERLRNLRSMDVAWRRVERSTRRAGDAFRSVIHRGAGFRLTRLMVEDTWEPLANFDKHLPKLAAFTSLMTLAGSSVTALSGNILSLGRNIAYIVPAALVLPGALTSAGVSVAALIMGLSDMKENAQAAYATFAQIPEVTSRAFWTSAAGVQSALQLLATDIRDGFAVVGAGAGSWFRDVILAVRDTISASDFEFMFGAVSSAFRIMEQASTGIAVILREFGLAGGRWVPQMANALKDATNNFARWLEVSANNGNMDRWIRRSWEAMKDLGVATRGVYRLFDQLSAMAERSGGASLRGLGEYLSGVAETLQKPHVAEAGERLFRSAHMSLTAFTDAVGPALGNLMLAFSTIAEQFGPNITGAVGGVLGAFIEGLASPGMQRSLLAFSEALRDIGDFIEPVLYQSGEVAGILDTITAAITPFGKMAATAVGGLLLVIDDLGPALSVAVAEMGEAAARLMSAVFVPTMNFIADQGDVIVAIGTMVGRGIDVIADLVTTLFEIPGGVQAALIAVGALGAGMAALNTAARVATSLKTLRTGADLLSVAFLGAEGNRSKLGAGLDTMRRSTVGRLGTMLVGIASSLTAVAAVAGATAIGVDMLKQSMLNSISAGIELDAVLRQIAASGDASAAWAGPDGKKVRGGGISFTQGIIGDLDDAENMVKAFRSRVEFGNRETGKLFGFISTGASDAVDHFSALDDQLVTIARDSLPVAQRAFRAQWRDLEQATFTAEEATSAFGDYAEMVRASVYEQSGVILSGRELVEAMQGQGQYARYASAGIAELTSGQHELTASSLAASEASFEAQQRMQAQVQAYQGLRDGIFQSAQSFADLSGAIANATTDGEFSLSKFKADLEKRAAEMEAWGDNMVALAGQIPNDMYMELLELGPAGAAAVQGLADAGAAELSEVSALWAPIAEGAAHDTTLAIMQALAASNPELFAQFDIMGIGGADAFVRAVEYGLRNGKTVEEAFAALPDRLRTNSADANRWEGAGKAAADNYKKGLSEGLKSPVSNEDRYPDGLPGSPSWVEAQRAKAREAGVAAREAYNEGWRGTGPGPEARLPGNPLPQQGLDPLPKAPVVKPVWDNSEFIHRAIDAKEKTELAMGEFRKLQEQVRPGLPATGVSSLGDLGSAAEGSTDRLGGVGQVFAQQAAVLQIAALNVGVAAQMMNLAVATAMGQVSAAVLVGAAQVSVGALQMSVASQVAAVQVAGAFRTMAAGAASGGAAVRATASLTARSLRGAFSGVNLFSQGARIMASLNAGLRSRIGAIRATLQSVTASIPQWKGPPKRDATLLTNAGKLIGQSLVDGLQASFDGSLFPYLRDVTGEIAQLGAAPNAALRGNVGRAQAAAAPADSGRAGVQVTVHNPLPEKTSDTTRKALAQAAVLLPG